MKTEPLLEITGDSGMFTDHKALRKALRVFCDELVLPTNLYVSLVFCTSAEMREINKKFRADDKTTDVLSFPSELIADPNLTTNGERPFMGEILIDTNYIDEQTEPDMFDQAVLHVFIHGLLHLRGFDHLGFQPREIMLQKEKKIMDLIKQEGKIGR
jgi:probable rRNA maturation factor